MSQNVMLASVDLSSLPQAARDALLKAVPSTPPSKPIVEQGVIEHEVAIAGARVRYRASTGMMPLRDGAGKLTAELFYIAYERLGVENTARRPICFAFNGGPGSSSVWLHLGAMGPRRVALGPEGQPPTPPGLITDNAHSWLDVADLVFIDPVSTGFSRADSPEDTRQFHDLQGDIASIAEFIRLYITRHERWLSPKIVVGESYGTTRAAGLAAHLQSEHGIYLNGLIMVSPALDFSTLDFNEANDLPFWLYLPTYTAAAWYHKRLAPPLQSSLEAALTRAEAFAIGPYLAALAAGDRLSPPQFSLIAAELAQLTGLSEDFVKRANLRIVDTLFYKELLRDQGTIIGRLDARYVGWDRDDAGAAPEFDPSYSAIGGAYTAALNSYMREELRARSDLKYEILSMSANQAWNFRAKDRYPSTAELLRKAMAENSALKMLVCNGYYDMATPHFASDYTLARLALRPHRRADVRIARYESGHMMYVREPDLARLKLDAAAFIDWATASAAAAPSLSA